MKNFLLSSWGALQPIRNYFRKKWFTLILYHQINQAYFKEHFEYLSNQYNITPLSSLREHYEHGAPLPENSLFITFDDGWRSNYSLLPFIEEKEIPITIFLTTGLIGSRKIPAPLNYFQGKSIIGFTDNYPTQDERTMLTKLEIKEMSSIIDFQTHGVNHFPSTSLSSEQFRTELLDSKIDIEKITGKTVYAFAYPYNRASDREAQIVKSCGFSLARIGGRKMNYLDTNQFLLNSIGIEQNCSLSKFRKIILNAELKTIYKNNGQA